MTKLQLAKEIVEEHTNPDGTSKLSKAKLSAILHKRHPDVFDSQEHARSNIRTVTGANGDYNRKHKRTLAVWKGLQLPKPEKNNFSKVIVNQKRIGILSDIHFPYYDKKALNVAIEYLIDWKPDCIILNGDTIDMYHASNFERDPKNRKLKYEFDMVRAFIVQLVALFPKCRIIYKAGNHCERYENKILQRIPEFIDLKWMTLETALHWGQSYKIEVVKNKRIIKAGHLNICHGHEFSKGFIAPVNVARGFYLKAKANVIAGHHHRISENTELDINGKLIGAWSTGCLCELNPKYMPINGWSHGFATVEITDNAGNFKVNNIKIINGKIA